MIDNYKDLTVGKYKELRQIRIDNPDAEDIDIQMEMVSVLDGRSVDELGDLPISEYGKLCSKLNFLQQPPKVTSKVAKKIKLGQHTYTVTTDVTKLTTAQYVDYMTLSKENDMDGKITQYLCIFLVPEGKKYNDGYDIVDVVNDIEDFLSIEIALDVCFFFRQKSIGLIKAFLVYFKRGTKRMMKKEKDEKVKEQMKEIVERTSQSISLLNTMGGYIM